MYVCKYLLIYFICFKLLSQFILFSLSFSPYGRFDIWEMQRLNLRWLNQQKESHLRHQVLGSGEDLAMEKASTLLNWGTATFSQRIRLEKHRHLSLGKTQRASPSQPSAVLSGLSLSWHLDSFLMLRHKSYLDHSRWSGGFSVVLTTALQLVLPPPAWSLFKSPGQIFPNCEWTLELMPRVSVQPQDSKIIIVRFHEALLSNAVSMSVGHTHHLGAQTSVVSHPLPD